MPNELSLLEEEALKEHLAFLSDQPALANREAWIARGYADENGDPTKLGEDYLMLEDLGLFDQSGQLTEKGQAYAMDRGEALLEKNLPAYVIRERAGLNEMPEQSFGETLSGLGDFVWNAVKGTGRMLRATPNPMLPTTLLPADSEQEAEDILTRQSFAEGALESPSALGSGGVAILEKGWAKLTGDEQAYYASKQRHDRFQSDLDDAEAGDLYGNLIDSKAAVDALNASREQAIKRLGPQQAATIEREGEAAGALVGDPSNYLTAGAGALVGSAEKLPIIARISAKAEQATMAALKAEQAQVALAKARVTIDKSGRAAEVAARMAQDVSPLNPARADQFRSVAARLATQADASARAMPALEATAADATAHAAKLAESSGGAQRVMAALDQMKQVGRQVRSAPARAIAPVLEGIGEGLMRADSWIDANLKAASKLRGLSAAFGIGSGNFGAAVPAAVLASGPAIKGVGNFTRVLGQELMQARGTVPFWRRVAENSATSPLGRATAHAMDFATLGGKVPNVVGRTARGIAAAAPVDMGFEIIGSGGDLSGNTLKQGLAESLIFGGGGAFGGAMMKGNLADLRARAAGDELNFRRSLSPEQSKAFSRMNPGARKSMSIYAATFPNLKFEITDSGPSSFNRQTNTATINVNQSDFLRPVIAHEVNHFLQVSGQMEEGIRAMLLGDGDTGGVLRSKDGRLDKNFSDFTDAYNGRLAESGMPALSLDEMALEYFNEATVDHLLGDTDSGRLQAQARRSKGERAIKRIVEATIPRLPIIRDLFIRTGGAIDSKGRMVEGNGLLAAGVREIPGAKKMIREAREEAMKRGRPTLPESKPVPIEITNPVDQKPLIDSMHSLFETDPDGKVLTDERGVPQVITRETENKRATAGAEALKVIDAEIQAEADAVEGKQAVDPEPIDPADTVATEEAQSETPEQKSRRVKRRENGKYEGTHLSPKALQAIRKSQKLNKLQMQVLRMLNRASRDMTGETFSVINHPALKTDQFGRKTYQALGATMREVVPLGFHINKKGALSVVLMSVTQLVDNIRTRAASETGKRLYSGNEIAIRNDVEAVVNLHRQGLKTDAYFAEKYGDQGPKYKNFINTVLDLATPDQRANNPLFEEDSINDKSKGVVRSYRIDRINQAARLQGRTPLPLNYESVKLNLLPLGTPEGISNLMEPSRIIPRNKIERPDQVDAIAAIYQNNQGWKGRPILTLSDADGMKAITASHRLAAAKKTGIDVPVVALDANDLQNFLNENPSDWVVDSDGFYAASEEVQQMVLEEAKRNGANFPNLDEAIHLLRLENESNDLDPPSRASLK